MANANAPPDLERLGKANLAALREIWRTELGCEPPRLRAPDLLRRELAWRLQARVFGDLEPRLRRRLETLARRDERPRAATRARPEVGSTLIKEWDGVSYTVVILDVGYLFQGHTYRSLSQIAREITGTRWSGPRFFGLRS